MSEAYSREMALFTAPGQVASLTLPDGFRFIAFVHGLRPYIFPISESGTYEIDIPAMLAKGKYPVGVSTVDAAHADQLAQMPASAVDDMLAALNPGASAEGGGE